MYIVQCWREVSCININISTSYDPGPAGEGRR